MAGKRCRGCGAEIDAYNWCGPCRLDRHAIRRLERKGYTVTQLTLPRFGGETYEPERDGQRLKRLVDRVEAFMADRCWHRLPAIQRACGGTEASVSARLRDLRKHRFGAHLIERRCVAGGLWEYRHAPDCCREET